MTVAVADDQSNITQIVLASNYERTASGQRLPRELYASVTLGAESLHDALPESYKWATLVYTSLAIINNAAIEAPVLHVGLDFTEPKSGEHEYLARLTDDERGIPHFTRLTLPTALQTFWRPFVALPKERRDRLGRALAHYNEALRHTLDGKQVFVLNALWMAVEAITPLARDTEIAEAGSAEALREQWGLTAPSCANCGHAYRVADLDPEVRKRIIFGGNDELYREAKIASDKLEHAGWNFEQISELAAQHSYALAAVVRSWILRYLVDDAQAIDRLLAHDLEEPLPCEPSSIHITSTLVGDVAAPSADGWPYPRHTFQPEIALALENSNGTMTLVLTGEQPRLLAGPGVTELGTQVRLEQRPAGLKRSEDE